MALNFQTYGLLFIPIISLFAMLEGHPVEKINGEYLSGKEGVGKDALYKMVPNEEFCIYCNKDKGIWCLSRLEHMNSDNMYAACKTKSKHPFLLDEDKQEVWKIYNQAEKKWETSADLVKAYDALEEEEEVQAKDA